MKTLIGIAIILSFVSVANSSYANDWCKSDFVKSWENDRNDTVVRLTKLWLNTASEEKLNREVLAMTRKEIHLGNCSPPIDINDLYISHIQEAEPKTIPVAVLLFYFKRNGIDLNPKGLFEGNSFDIKRPRRVR